ncbi:hypothetical protein CPB83DRAFT_790071 [Crepidotus variabilis]|uniref:MYND-type domain-containing protein n=1 Tax=Crepidotus variabilis TaxID=179855 RepID=A0A9P6JR28_9AGAR|nr:hypothetical protein CPB83DRAFT_790071 [Crepidotus variabilis]
MSFGSDSVQVHLPLAALDKCFRCRKTDAKLRVCSSCGEVLYCSEECQKKDWKAHKSNCGKTVRLDLETYYPFVAALQYTNHLLLLHRPATLHPALERKILNSPNPGSTEDILLLPDGSDEGSRIILLGDKIEESERDTPTWWPTARSAQVRNKLMRRIMTEGNMLPIVLSTALALVTEIYSTPHSRTDGARLRLQSRHSPIADIGIAKGPIRVTSKDRLSYMLKENSEFILGQDPKEHCWIYFITLDGHEYILDCGMFAFNMATGVNAKEYCQPATALPPYTWVPVMPLTAGWNPKHRFSVLRNVELRKATMVMMRVGTKPMRHGPEEDYILSWMEYVGGRTCTKLEKATMMELLQDNSLVFRLNLITREYQNFPQTPADVTVSVDLDPDQDPSTHPDFNRQAQAQERYLKAKTKQLRKGQISAKQWDRALDRWLALKRLDEVRREAAAASRR